MIAVKETLCTSCGHRQVCSLTRTFLKAQESVDKLSVGTEDNGIIRVIDLEWLDVRLNCSHFQAKTNVRKGE